MIVNAWTELSCSRRMCGGNQDSRKPKWTSVERRYYSPYDVETACTESILWRGEKNAKNMWFYTSRQSESMSNMSCETIPMFASLWSTLGAPLCQGNMSRWNGIAFLFGTGISHNAPHVALSIEWQWFRAKCDLGNFYIQDGITVFPDRKYVQGCNRSSIELVEFRVEVEKRGLLFVTRVPIWSIASKEHGRFWFWSFSIIDLFR